MLIISKKCEFEKVLLLPESDKTVKICFVLRYFSQKHTSLCSLPDGKYAPDIHSL